MSKETSKKYHYFYKITNNINSHFYYGVHNTDDLDDGYMGSGTRLHYAYKKYGVENFTKEILKFFDTSKEAFEYEAEVVNEELIKRDDCYNVQLGGIYFNTTGLVSVRDKDGNCFDVEKNDPRYLSGKLVGVTKGMATVKDSEGNTFLVDKNNPDYLSGKLVGVTKGRVIVKDYKGNIFLIDKNSPEYLTGKLKPIWVGRKHSAETKEKMKKVYEIYNHQIGKNNSHYGHCWVMKDGISKSIKKEYLDDYILNGWKRGRKMK